IGSGVLLGAIALACFAAGPGASMVIVCIVILLATAEGVAAFRRAQYHPATLLGLVAVLSLLIETYNKGVAALPLVLVLLVAGSFIWYPARVAAGAPAAWPPRPLVPRRGRGGPPSRCRASRRRSSSSCGSAPSGPSPRCCSTPT